MSWGIFLFAIIALLTLSITYDFLECWVALGVILGMFFLQKRNSRYWQRAFFVGMGVFLVGRYIWWRTFNTLETDGAASFLCTWALYLAEVYSVIFCLWGIIVNFSPTHRNSLPMQGDRDVFPSVDVLIPSYNESQEIIETTLIAAAQIDYPREKLQVYLCDDGGTDDKCKTLEAARQRHESLQTLCRRWGVGYLTREHNHRAKAGNLNEALKRTKGELILVLDVDHVPSGDILKKTVGYFQRDPKLFLVQTPHFFINPDPIERNLKTYEYMPRETDMFHLYVQRGLDFWNASFFCGSAAVLRRVCLEENGGFSMETVTEDAETSLALHARGYKSVYLPIPLVAGLAPETFKDFIRQRTRWAQGMIQLLLLKKPWATRGLSFMQRFCYTGLGCFWFFSYARIIFLLAPIAYLLFGIKIYHTDAWGFVVYVVPYLAAMISLSNCLFGHVRWFFISELYEILQSFYCVRAIARAIWNPRSSHFHVTAKGVELKKDSISALSIPFYIIFALTWMSLFFGVARLWCEPAAAGGVLGAMFWGLLNAIWMTSAIGALFERKQIRKTPRISKLCGAELTADARVWKGFSWDISVGGASLVFPGVHHARLPLGSQAVLRLREGREHLEIDVRIRRFEKKSDNVIVGVEFIPQTQEARSEKVRFILGHSERWKDMQDRSHRVRSAFSSMRLLVRLGLESVGAQGVYFWENVTRKKALAAPRG
ncbi:MAG: UDP-forming cellulose synthase catalytic subunit [Verrucomicrobiota bacterium]